MPLMGEPVTRRTLLSWSTGKDSAWALQVLRQDPSHDVAGLFCTVNKAFDRVAMHGVRVELLRRQAAATGLPLRLVEIPDPCSNEQYAQAMQGLVAAARQDGIDCFAFGDLFLDDIRSYREHSLRGTGIEAAFPLWGRPTRELAQSMIDGGLRAVISCVDPKRMPADRCGLDFDADFVARLPAGVDPCGEHGEFHSFAFDGPMFRRPVEITVGETVERGGFVFTDLLPAHATR